MEESAGVPHPVVSKGASQWRTIDLPRDAAFYKETSSLVYSVALRILADTADAEEVTVDVYTQIWRSAKSFDAGRGSVISWLVMLTRSRALDRVRSRGAKGCTTEPVPANLEIADESPNPEKMSVLEQQRQRIR